MKKYLLIAILFSCSVFSSNKEKSYSVQYNKKHKRNSKRFKSADIKRKSNKRKSIFTPKKKSLNLDAPLNISETLKSSPKKIKKILVNNTNTEHIQNIFLASLDADNFDFFEHIKESKDHTFTVSALNNHNIMKPYYCDDIIAKVVNLLNDQNIHSCQIINNDVILKLLGMGEFAILKEFVSKYHNNWTVVNKNLADLVTSLIMNKNDLDEDLLLIMSKKLLDHFSDEGDLNTIKRFYQINSDYALNTLLAMYSKHSDESKYDKNEVLEEIYKKQDLINKDHLEKLIESQLDLNDSSFEEIYNKVVYDFLQYHQIDAENVNFKEDKEVLLSISKNNHNLHSSFEEYLTYINNNNDIFKNIYEHHPFYNHNDILRDKRFINKNVYSVLTKFFDWIVIDCEQQIDEFFKCLKENITNPDNENQVTITQMLTRISMLLDNMIKTINKIKVDHAVLGKEYNSINTCLHNIKYLKGYFQSSTRDQNEALGGERVDNDEPEYIFLKEFHIKTLSKAPERIPSIIDLIDINSIMALYQKINFYQNTHEEIAKRIYEMNPEQKYNYYSKRLSTLNDDQICSILYKSIRHVPANLFCDLVEKISDYEISQHNAEALSYCLNNIIKRIINTNNNITGYYGLQLIKTLLHLAKNKHEGNTENILYDNLLIKIMNEDISMHIADASITVDKVEHLDPYDSYHMDLLKLFIETHSNQEWKDKNLTQAEQDLFKKLTGSDWNNGAALEQLFLYTKNEIDTLLNSGEYEKVAEIINNNTCSCTNDEDYINILIKFLKATKDGHWLNAVNILFKEKNIKNYTKATIELIKEATDHISNDDHYTFLISEVEKVFTDKEITDLGIFSYLLDIFKTKNYSTQTLNDDDSFNQLIKKEYVKYYYRLTKTLIRSNN